MKLNKKIAAAVGAGGIVVAASGIAYAFYNASASGSADGSAAVTQSTVSAVTLSDGGTITGLVPGGTQNATVTISNPNTFAAHYPAFTITPTFKSSTTAACTAAEAALSGTKAVTAGVLAAGGTTTVQVPVTMADSLTQNQSDCNGASITVTYTIS